MSDYESLPILYALDASSALRHVDEVPNGLACGCTCPDPDCGQELVARNAGKKRIHHFAHQRGSCEWSVEHVLANLALEAISSAGSIALPGLEYFEIAKGGDVEISPARTLRVSSASLEQVSGRGAPELMVTCVAGGAEKRFAVVVSLIHPLKSAESERLASAGIDTVLIDLRASLRARKREMGKHFDRAGIVAGYQDRRFVEWLLLDEDCPFKSWAVNLKRAAMEAESAERERIRQAKRERQRREREREEALRCEARERLLAEQRAAEEAEATRLRMLREKEEADRLAAEEAAREEAEERARVDIMEQVCQQERQARDALGRRWARCEICGEVKPVDEFMMYGGAGRVNLGTCYDCGRK